MRELIRESLAQFPPKNLDHVFQAVERSFAILKNSGIDRIGYVSGMITSEGPEHIAKNTKLLETNTLSIRSQVDYPVFSATCIFTNEIYSNLAEMNLPYAQREPQFIFFWRKVLSLGVTDLHMTKKWDLSRGARDEHQTGQVLNLKIHY